MYCIGNCVGCIQRDRFCGSFQHDGRLLDRFYLRSDRDRFPVLCICGCLLKRRGCKSKFYGFPIARIGVIYLVVQLLVSIAEMCWASKIPAWVVLIINVIIFAVAAIGCIAAETARDVVVGQEAKVKQNISNMRSLQAVSAGLAGQCSDEALKKDLQKLADEFKFSDPVSSNATSALEAELDAQLNGLKNALGNGDYDTAKSLCDKLLNGLSERNRICKLNK